MSDEVSSQLASMALAMGHAMHVAEEDMQDQEAAGADAASNVADRRRL